MSYDPHRYMGLLQSGFDRLGDIGQAGYQKYQKDQHSKSPLPAALQGYIHRLLQGEDPQKLGLEARNHPDMAGLIDSRLQNQPQPSPQSQVPDVGWNGGSPSLSGPGTMSPSGAQNPYPAQAPQQGQYNGGEPYPYIAHARHHELMQGQSLGAAPQQAAPQQPMRSVELPPQHQLPPQTMSLGGQQVQGVRATDAYSLAAQPMQGAPQVTAQQAGMTASRPPPPAPPPQAAPQAPQHQYTYGDLETLQPLLPTIEASRSREAVARTNAAAKADIENQRNQRIVLVQIMRENGLDDRAISDFLLKTEGLDVKQQQAVLDAWLGKYKADRAAEATLGSARTRADAPHGGQTSLDRQLHDQEMKIKDWTKTANWMAQPDIVAKVQHAMALAETYREQLREQGKLPSAPSQPAPAKPQPKSQPGKPTAAAKPPAGNTPMPGGDARNLQPKDGDRVTKNGKTFERRGGKWFPL